jgi:hypothetical protein
MTRKNSTGEEGEPEPDAPRTLRSMDMFARAPQKSCERRCRSAAVVRSMRTRSPRANREEGIMVFPLEQFGPDAQRMGQPGVPLEHPLVSRTERTLARTWSAGSEAGSAGGGKSARNAVVQSMVAWLRKFSAASSKRRLSKCS